MFCEVFGDQAAGQIVCGRAEVAATLIRAACEALAGLSRQPLDERDGLIVYDKPTLRKAIDLFRAVVTDEFVKFADEITASATASQVDMQSWITSGMS